MKSRHIAVVASLFLALMAADASACSCRRSSDKQKFADADLIVKGRMKLVTYGIEFPDPEHRNDPPARLTRGDFEIEQVVKGKFTGKTLAIYTGAGVGDCGMLGEFIGAAFYYHDDKFAVWEFGLSKTDVGGETFYSTSICNYRKAPQKTPQ